MTLWCLPLKLSKLLLKVSSCFIRILVLVYLHKNVSLDCSLGSQDFNLFQNDSNLLLCENRMSDHDYNYTVHIYTQNGSISQFRYGNNSKELVLQCGMQYFMNVTTECCGSNVTLARFCFQFVNCTNQYSPPGETYNLSVTLYFDCNQSTYNYVYTKEVPTSKLSL